MNEQRAGDAGAFIWYELMTPDPAGAREFYREVVGWDIEGESMMPGMDYRMIRCADGGHAGGVLAMDEAMRANGPPPGWFCYVHVTDVDAAAGQIEEAGGAIHMDPQTMEGVGRMAMVADPQGAVFYLMTPTPPANDPEAQSDVFDYAKPQRFRWNELWTTDPDAATELYTRLFGWRQEGGMPLGERGTYRFLYRGEGMIGAIGPALPDGRGTRWDFYIGVDDIDRAVSAVKAGGGTVEGEPGQIPGGDYATHATDPQGAAFGIVGPRKEQAR